MLPRPVRLVDHQNVHAIALQQPQALGEGELQPVHIPRVEGLRPPAELGGDDVGLRDPLQPLPQHLLAIQIARRGINIIDPDVNGPSDGASGLVERTTVGGNK